MTANANPKPFNVSYALVVRNVRKLFWNQPRCGRVQIQL